MGRAQVRVTKQSIHTRAHVYARIINLLFAERRLSGRLVAASRGARHLSLGIRLDNPLRLDTALDLAEPLALAANTPAVLAQRLPAQPGLVTYQFQLAWGYWKTYTRSDVTGLGVGLAENHRQVDFGFDPPHALVAGTSGSGKSETVKSILCGLFTAYAPGDLGAVIVDPHRDYYENFRNAAHLAAPIASTPEEIGVALRWAGQELARRVQAGARDARQIVIVIEEAEDYLDAEQLAIARSIAGEARKFGMHLIVSAKKPTQRNLPDLLDKLLNRWVGLVDNANTSALLTGHAGLACHKLTGKGDFVHVVGPDLDRLQVAMTTPADYARLPRAEIRAPAVEPEDTPRALNLEGSRDEDEDSPRALGFPVPDKGGRPPTVLDPRKVAYYLVYPGGPNAVTRAIAETVLSLKRQGHTAHRDFAAELYDEIGRLMAARRGAPA
jgi:hypothetical protein